MNWDGYELNELLGMVTDPDRVAMVAGAWRDLGGSLTRSADDLSRSLRILLRYWQGERAAVVASANRIGQLGQITSGLADSIEEAGVMLRATRNMMPDPPPVPAPAADTATAAAGPLGTATSAVLTGLTSLFEINAAGVADQRQASRAMRRYEQAAMTIDATTPALRRSADPGVRTPHGSTPSFAADPAGRWNALTGGPGEGRRGFALFGDGSGRHSAPRHELTAKGA